MSRHVERTTLKKQMFKHREHTQPNRCAFCLAHRCGAPGPCFQRAPASISTARGDSEQTTKDPEEDHDPRTPTSSGHPQEPPQLLRRRGPATGSSEAKYSLEREKFWNVHSTQWSVYLNNFGNTVLGSVLPTGHWRKEASSQPTKVA